MWREQATGSARADGLGARANSATLAAWPLTGLHDVVSAVVVYKSWGICTDCGYEGVLEYRHVAGEVYDDEAALGVMLLQRCPACDIAEHALMPMDFYRELLAEATTEGSGP